jgi:uncharacterized OB-fold protein
MEIPRHWRMQMARYTLAGRVCPHCGAKIFPRRDVCPQCRYEIRQACGENGKATEMLSFVGVNVPLEAQH